MKTSIREVRRKDLQRAAYDTIRRHGFENTTIAKVAETVGMSQGIVHHYYRDKDELINAAIRFMLTQIRDSSVKRLRASSKTEDRIMAVAESVLAGEDFYGVQLARLWLSYCAHAANSSKYTKYIYVSTRRAISNLAHALQDWMPRSEAYEIADQIVYLIDGIWVRLATAPNPPTHEEALIIIQRFVDRCRPLEANRTQSIALKKRKG